MGSTAATRRAASGQRALASAWVAVSALACTSEPAPPPPATADLTRDILETHLEVDLATQTASARLVLAPAATTGASFEIGDLEILGVRQGDGDLSWTDQGDRLDVGVPGDEPEVTVDYRFWFHDQFDGADADGLTLLWPYFCGNLFPCHSNPADGTRFSLTLANPSGTAIFPATIAVDAPSYMAAWAIGDYQRLDLGVTSAGTTIGIWHRPGEGSDAAAGGQHLRAAFEWLETTLGPYPFGSDVGSVAVTWGAGQFGGMEHHPYWHVAAAALASGETHVHEAAHGWFGNGVRIACWEDFVLSEGTSSYLAARAIEVVAGADAGAAVWSDYQRRLSRAGSGPSWPTTCGEIDVIADGLFSDLPYMRGAYFYRAVADRVGAAELDAALSLFFRRYVGRAARMTDLLAVITEATGFDPTACAEGWLRGGTLGANGACP